MRASYKHNFVHNNMFMKRGTKTYLAFLGFSSIPNELS